MHISKCHMDTVNMYNSYLSVILQYKWKHFLRLIEASKIISEIFYTFFHTRSLTSHCQHGLKWLWPLTWTERMTMGECDQKRMGGEITRGTEVKGWRRGLCRFQIAQNQNSRGIG